MTPHERQAATGLCPTETGGAGAAAPAAEVAPATSLATLLAGHILRDGEVILLLLRPSRWYILLTSLRFLAAVAILMTLAVIFDDKLGFLSRQYFDLGIFAMSCRLMWATLQWMGRLYVLTDMRILRLSGVFTVNVFDCPLRKVARTILEGTLAERLLRLGSIVIVPQDEDKPLGTWRIISQPRQVHEQILAAINRARHNGHAL
jgi:hypothetical protein